jgi:hypothetical protein
MHLARDCCIDSEAGFEVDLYDNAHVPVALAHRHASTSHVLGGNVLDLLVRYGLGADKKGRQHLR